MKKASNLLFALFLGLITANAQNYQWAKSIGSVGFDEGQSIFVDDLGNVYTTGYFERTVDFDPGTGTSNLTAVHRLDIFISKLDAAGNFVWAKSMGGNSSDVSNSIAVDNSGNVYTTGYFQGTVDFDPGVGTSNLTSAGGIDIFISKLDTAGNFVWAKRIGGAHRDLSNSIAVDGSGNVYTTGYFERTVDFDPGVGTSNLTAAWLTDIFISKLDAAGNFVWAKRIGDLNGDISQSITLDSSGNVYITGFFSGTVDFDPGVGTSNLTSAGNFDIFISKLDTAGNFIWAKSMGGPLEDKSFSIAVDGSGNVYTTGSFTGTADFDPRVGTSNLTSAGYKDIFISKLDATGNFIWAKSIGGPLEEFSFAIALDGYGNLYTTGIFQGTVDFDPGTGISNLTSSGLQNSFTLKLDTAGNFIWATNIGANTSTSNFITVDRSGNLYTTGSFQGTADFDPGVGTSNLTSAGGYNIFISKLGPTVVGTIENSIENTLSVYPNPTKGAIKIELGASYNEVIVIIRNPIGQEVLRKSYIGSNFLQLNIPGETGLYFIEVYSNDERAILKVVKN